MDNSDLDSDRRRPTAEFHLLEQALHSLIKMKKALDEHMVDEMAEINKANKETANVYAMLQAEIAKWGVIITITLVSFSVIHFIK